MATERMETTATRGDAAAGGGAGSRPSRRRALALAAAAALWAAVVLIGYFPDLARHALRLVGGEGPARDEERGRIVLPGDIDAGRVADAAWAVLGALVLAGIAVALGRRLMIVARLARPLGLWEALVALALGLTGIALTMAAMGAAGVLTRTGVGALTGALAAHAAWTALRGDLRPPPRRPATSPAGRGRIVAAGAAAVVAVFGAVALVGALWPEVEFDAVWYHLWLPEQHLEAGRLVDHPQEYVSLYPQDLELLYGWGLAWGGVVGAKLVNLMVGVAALGATYGLARRLVPPAWALVAVALTLSAPVVLWEMTTAYADVAVALLAALVAGELLDWRRTRRRGDLLRAALLIGAALGVKHLSLLLLAVAVAVVLATPWPPWRRPARRAGDAALLAGVAVAVAAPWYARSLAATGNPVFPELYGLFGAPADRWNDRTEAGLSAFLERFGPDRTPLELLRLPWTLTTQPDRFDGSIGPIFLILLPLLALPLAARRMPVGAGALGLMTLGYLALWASPVSSFQARFLVVVVPWLAVLGVVGLRALALRLDAAGLARTATALPLAALVVVLANVPPLTPWHGRTIIEGPGYAIGYVNHTVRDIELAAAVDDEAAQEMLDRRVRGHRAIRWANDALPDGTRILSEVGGIHLWSDHPLLMSYTVAADRALGATGPRRGARMAEALAGLGVGAILVDREGTLDDAIRPLGDRLRRAYADDEVVVYSLGDAGEPEGAAASEAQRSGGRSGAPPDMEPSTSSS